MFYLLISAGLVCSAEPHLPHTLRNLANVTDGQTDGRVTSLHNTPTVGGTKKERTKFSSVQMR